MERTIKVTGIGNISIKPDITIVSMRISDVLPSYEEALRASAYVVKLIKDAIEIAGIKRETLKTKYFNVDTHYESYYDENKNHRSRLDGYEYSQDLKFEFDIDNKMLGRILYELSQIHSVFPRITIGYGIKDTESAKNKLLASAIKDAKVKVSVIAEAAGVSLGDIIDINYSWIDVEFSSRLFSFDAMKCSAVPSESIDVDIEPDDIRRSDNVTITYKIN